MTTLFPVLSPPGICAPEFVPCVGLGFSLYSTLRGVSHMPNVPKLEKKRELLAPKSVGPLGKVVLMGGAALAGLGVIPSSSVLPTPKPGIQSVGTPPAPTPAAPFPLPSVQTNVYL